MKQVLSFRPDQDLSERIAEIVARKYDSASDFLAEAAVEKVRRIETEEAFAIARGAWKPEDYPEFATEDDIVRWIRQLRGHVD